MDERHWLLATTLAGFILVAVFFVSVWVVTAKPPGYVLAKIERAFSFTQEQDGTEKTKEAQEKHGLGILARLVAIVALPILGMVVRLISVAAWFDWQLKDVARLLVGNASRKALLQLKNKKFSAMRKEIEDILSAAPVDSFYIWFALAKKDNLLVQWTRNRRHYQYLAENALTATVLGLGGAIFIVWATHSLKLNWTIHPFARLAVCLAGILWLLGIRSIRNSMKRAVDSVELAWVLERMDPDVRNQVLSLTNLSRGVCSCPPTWFDNFQDFWKSVKPW